jgi:hypothetical protein
VHQIALIPFHNLPWSKLQSWRTHMISSALCLMDIARK